MPCVINVYSKSDSKLGRLLSNFAHTPFIFDGITFNSVEAWWYYYITGETHLELCPLYGYMAKCTGKQLPITNRVISKDLLLKVYLAKMKYNPYIADMLMQYHGDFDHYYVYGGRKVPATKWLWTAKLWSDVRNILLNH